MTRKYHKWFSPRLCRDMELLIFGDRGTRVLVFPTREGRFFDYENFGIAGSLRDRIESGRLQLFCVDSLDSESLYCWRRPPHERIQRHIQYESYILEEVIPLSLACNESPGLIAHGCSIGAYHAVNIAFRHPDLFTDVVALSGRYDLTRRVGPFDDLFSGYYNEDIYFNTPNHFIPNLTHDALLAALRRIRIVLAVGVEDPFCESNILLSRALSNKSIPHDLLFWDGEAHRAGYWRRMVRFYLGND
ncbi:MAG: esterase family protein [Capsulimonadaceae bacterium]